MTNEWNGPRICIKNFRMKETCGFTQIADEMISGSRPSIGSFWVTHTHNDSWKRNPIESHKQRNHQTSARGGGGIEATKIQRGGRIDGGPSTGKMSSKNKAGDAFCCLVQCVAATVLHLTKVTQNKRPTDTDVTRDQQTGQLSLVSLLFLQPALTHTHTHFGVCIVYGAVARTIFSFCRLFFFGCCHRCHQSRSKNVAKRRRFVFCCRHPTPPPPQRSWSFAASINHSSNQSTRGLFLCSPLRGGVVDIHKVRSQSSRSLFLSLAHAPKITRN